MWKIIQVCPVYKSRTSPIWLITSQSVNSKWLAQWWMMTLIAAPTHPKPKYRYPILILLASLISTQIITAEFQTCGESECSWYQASWVWHFGDLVNQHQGGNSPVVGVVSPRRELVVIVWHQSFQPQSTIPRICQGSPSPPILRC